MGKTVADVLGMAKEVKMVDLRFTDLLGVWHHFSLPSQEVEAELFEDGIGFDGSSIRGFQEIHESDMILIPDPDTAFLDQLLEIPTLVISCDIYDPVTRQPYSRDTRYVAKKAEEYLVSTGIADTGSRSPSPAIKANPGVGTPSACSSSLVRYLSIAIAEPITPLPV